MLQTIPFSGVDAISVASENSISTLTTPSDLPQLYVLSYDDINPTMQWRKMFLAMDGWKEYTDIVKIMKNMLQKDKIILLHVLWKRQDILFMSLVFYN